MNNIRKINKIVILSVILLIIMNLISVFNYKVFAEEDRYKKMTGEATNFINKGKQEVKKTMGDKISDITQEFVPIGQILTMIGAGVMVAVTTFMGIKYLTSGPDAQAKLKEQLIGVVVAGVVIFGAYGIWEIVINIAKNFDG